MRYSLDVIFEDNHLLVVNKPAMLPTMGVQSGQASLVTVAREYLKNKYNKPGNVYVGVVSRLDSFVSGVVVLAKTSKAAARLNQQFAHSQAKKKYWAIVPSAGCDRVGELEHWLVKDESNHRMMTVEPDYGNDAKRANLRYRQIGEFNDKSLLEIELITGRKHQIRVQMSASGYPIIGDKKYGSQIRFKTGIALHSYSLSIIHPTLKQPKTFVQPPPGWWNISRYVS